MEKLTVKLLSEVISDIKSKVVNSFVSHLSVISSEDVIFTFSFYRKEKLLLSLNHQSPFISLVDIDENFHTLLGQMNDFLRKEIQGAYLTDITQKENDRIVIMEFHKTNDLFEPITRYLVIELIPHRSNLILLDDNKKVIFATHYTTLESIHPIVRGMTYIDLDSPINTESMSVDLDTFKLSASHFLDEAKEKRRKDQYSHLLVFVKNKLKSLYKKLTILQNGIDSAKECLSYAELGNLIYTTNGDIELIKEYVDDSVLPFYDFDLSYSDNASIYFKKYKKAKSTIEHNKEELTKAHDEIKYYERLSLQISIGDDSDLEELKLILNPSKGRKEDKKKNNKKLKVSPNYVTYKGVRIGYGKTDEQNNILTFQKASIKDTFIHIVDYPGSHIVIFNDDPSDEILEIASQMSILLSKKEDGEVQITKIKNVHKGDKLGLVNLKTYTIRHVNKVSEEVRKLLETTKKM